MRYLLDTTVIIDYVNGHPAAGELVRRLFGQADELYTCAVVTCEALSGGSVLEREAAGRLLEALEFVALSPAAARHAGESRRREGGPRRSLGDALIGALAHSLDATVVTRDPRDFETQGIPVLRY